MKKQIKKSNIYWVRALNHQGDHVIIRYQWIGKIFRMKIEHL